MLGVIRAAIALAAFAAGWTASRRHGLRTAIVVAAHWCWTHRETLAASALMIVALTFAALGLLKAEIALFTCAGPLMGWLKGRKRQRDRDNVSKELRAASGRSSSPFASDESDDDSQTAGPNWPPFETATDADNRDEKCSTGA